MKTTSKAAAKFERVMHEFAQGKLKSHDKPVTDKRHALAIAYGEARQVNPNYGVRMMKQGGIAGNELQKIYETGTAKKLWEAWSPDQRTHFIIDHSGEFFELMDDDFNKSAKAFITLTYDTLPSPIRKSLIIHHAMGMYRKGGPVETNKGIDLFEDYENIPTKVQKILDKYEQGIIDGDYDELKKAKDALEKIGYTFEYYLDGQAYDLRKIGEMGKVEYAEKHYIGLMGDERFEPFAKIIKGSNNFEDAFSKLKGMEVSGDISDAFDEKYNPNKKLSLKESFKKFYDQIKGNSMNEGGIAGERITGIGMGQKMRLGIYKKDELFSVYNEKNENKLSDDYPDLQLAKAFMQGIEQGYENKHKPEYVKGRYHLVKVNSFTLLKTDRKEVADAYIDGFEKAQTIKLGKGGEVPLNLSPAKKQLQDRINTLKATKASAGEAAQKSIQKKIDKLQAELDYNPSSKQKVKDNQGKFALDVPEEHSKFIYKKLWSMDILPKVVTLGDKSSIVVNSKINLEKAYDVYSDRMKDKEQKPLPLSKISRKV